MRNFKNLLVTVALTCVFFSGALAQEGRDYFLGDWKVLVKGTPNGDAEIPMRFEKNGDALSGYFVNPESGEEEPMDSAELEGKNLLLAFYIAGYDVTMTLAKETDNKIKGSLMGMFDTEGTRMIEADAYFMGSWNVFVEGTPEGDVQIPVRFEKNGDTVSGYFTNPESGQEEEMDSAEIKDETLSMAFYIVGYDVTIKLKKESENNMTGSLMDMFDAKAVRVIEDAVSAEDYYLGSWDVLVVGTPNGDVTIPMRFEEGEAGISGYFTDPQDGTEYEMTSVEMQDSTISGSFTLMDYDLTFYLKSENANEAKGSLMEMFSMTATRKE